MSPTTASEQQPAAERATDVTAQHPSAAGHAARHLGSHLRLWTVAAAGVALDLWSKNWAFDTLYQGGRRELIPYVLEFQTMMNSGALFGIGSGQTTLFLIASVLALGLVLWMFGQSSPRNWLLHIAFGGILAGAAGNMYDRVFVQVIAVRNPGGATRFYVKSESPDGEQVILREYPPRAGDKPIVRPIAQASRLPKATGHVRDFIKIPTTLPRWAWIPARFSGKELWPWVFNVADMLLVGGVGILAIRLWRERGTGRPARRGSGLDSASPEA